MTADCVPVLLADARAGVAAAVHAGRVGAQRGVVARAVEAMLARGAQAGDISALLGPAVSGRQLRGARRDGRRGRGGVAGQPHHHLGRHARPRPASRNRLPAQRFGCQCDRRRPALHGRRPDIVQPSPQCARPGGWRRWCGWNDRDGGGRFRARRPPNRNWPMRWGRCDRDSRRPRRRPAAMSAKLNFCRLPNSFQQPMSRFCRDWVVGRLANRANRKRRRRSPKSRGCWRSDRRLAGLHWHMVGQIQRNKARSLARLGPHRALGRAARGWSPRWIGRWPRRWPTAAAENRCASMSRSASTATCPAAASTWPRPARSTRSARQVEASQSLELVGLMGIPPLDWDPDEAFDAAADRSTAGCSSPIRDAVGLSAGMSNDLEIAVKHGSTCVRVGTALLGPRPLPSP